MPRKIKNLEFHVDLHGSTRIFDSFEKAVETAAIHSIGEGHPVNVDVVAQTERAARAFGGEAGVESYREDPDASVFHRITIQAEDLGRVP